MVRRYDDTIDVRMEEVPAEERGSDVRTPQPTAFVWRERLYVVRAVQTRWYERRAWWREAAAAALLGLRGDGPDRPGDDRPGDDGPGADAAGAGRATGTASVGVLDGAGYLDGETEVWRVEAAAGRSCPVGVFDLARSASVTPGAPSGGWRLTRVAD